MLPGCGGFLPLQHNLNAVSGTEQDLIAITGSCEAASGEASSGKRRSAVDCAGTCGRVALTRLKGTGSPDWLKTRTSCRSATCFAHRRRAAASPDTTGKEQTYPVKDQRHSPGDSVCPSSQNAGPESASSAVQATAFIHFIFHLLFWAVAARNTPRSEPVSPRR
jgi:hypothetical protein